MSSGPRPDQCKGRLIKAACLFILLQCHEKAGKERITTLTNQLMNEARGTAALRLSRRIILLPPARLRPTEAFIEARVREVSLEIEAAGYWRHPVWVERTSGVIMDGHHRREFALRRGYARVPCLMLDYSQVVLESRRPELDLGPIDVILRGLTRSPYPAKTTRHRLRDDDTFDCRVSLVQLRDGPASDNVHGMPAATDQ